MPNPEKKDFLKKREKTQKKDSELTRPGKVASDSGNTSSKKKTVRNPKKGFWAAWFGRKKENQSHAYSGVGKTKMTEG